MEEDFVFLAEAARETNYTAERLRQLAVDGKLPGSKKIGGRYWVVPRATVESLKSAPRPKPGPKPRTD